MSKRTKEYMDTIYKKILKGNKGELQWIVDFVSDNYRYWGGTKVNISFEEDMIVKVLRKLFVLLVESDIDSKYYPDIISDGYLYTLERIHNNPNIKNRKNIGSLVENYTERVISRNIRKINKHNEYFLDSAEYDNIVIDGFENRIINSQLDDYIDVLLKDLSDRLREIIRMIYGFDSEECTMVECAEIFRVGRGRISQIHAKALRILKNPIRSKLIKDYIDAEGINSCIHAYIVNDNAETSHSCDIPAMYIREGLWLETEDNLTKLIIKKSAIVNNKAVTKKKSVSRNKGIKRTKNILPKSIFKDGTKSNIISTYMEEKPNEKSSYYIKIEEPEQEQPNTYGFDIFSHIFKDRPDLKEYFDQCLKELSYKSGKRIYLGSNDELFMWCIFNDPMILFRKDQNENCIFSEKEVIDIAYEILIDIPDCLVDRPIYSNLKLISSYFYRISYLADEYYDLYNNFTDSLSDLSIYDNLYFFFGHFYYIMLMLYRREKSFYDIRCEYLYDTHMYNNFPYDKIIGIYNRFADIISNGNENYIERQFPDKFKKLFSDNGITDISDLMNFYSENDLVKFSRIKGISWEELNELKKIAIDMNLIPNDDVTN